MTSFVMLELTLEHDPLTQQATFAPYLEELAVHLRDAQERKPAGRVRAQAARIPGPRTPSMLVSDFPLDRLFGMLDEAGLSSVPGFLRGIGRSAIPVESTRALLDLLDDTRTQPRQTFHVSAKRTFDPMNGVELGAARAWLRVRASSPTDRFAHTFDRAVGSVEQFLVSLPVPMHAGRLTQLRLGLEAIGTIDAVPVQFSPMSVLDVLNLGYPLVQNTATTSHGDLTALFARVARATPPAGVVRWERSSFAFIRWADAASMRNVAALRERMHARARWLEDACR